MNELQRELRAAFDREQAELGETAGVRQRMLRQAMTAREPRRNQIFRTAVGMAAVLIAAAAVGTTVFIRERSHAGPAVTSTPSVSPSVSSSANPTRSPEPTPVAQPLQVPLTTPIMLFHDPVNSDQVDGVTWDGASTGWVARTGGAHGFTPNHVGTLYAAFKDRAIHDRIGQSLGRIDSNQKGFGIWADDERHYCQIVSASAIPPAGGEPASLQLAAPGEAAHTVAQIGTMGQNGGPSVVSCSILRDRAIVVDRSGIWVVKLSTGRAMLTQFETTAEVGVGASRDGQYLALTSGRSTEPQGWTTTVYGPDGSALGRVAGRIDGFSWDGSLAVVDYGAAPSIVRWRDGTVLWTGPDGVTFEASLPEPGGSRIAVAVRNPGYPWGSDGFPRLDVYVVGPDGHASEILQKVTVAF